MTLAFLFGQAPRNLFKAAKRWKAAGFPRATRKLIAQRLAACSECHHFNPGGYLGIGKCNVCGCSGLKLWLPSEECPLPEPIKRWRQAEVIQPATCLADSGETGS